MIMDGRTICRADKLITIGPPPTLSDGALIKLMKI